MLCGQWPMALLGAVRSTALRCSAPLCCALRTVRILRDLRVPLGHWGERKKERERNGQRTGHDAERAHSRKKTRLRRAMALRKPPCGRRTNRRIGTTYTPGLPKSGEQRTHSRSWAERRCRSSNRGAAWQNGGKAMPHHQARTDYERIRGNDALRRCERDSL